MSDSKIANNIQRPLNYRSFNASEVEQFWEYQIGIKLLIDKIGRLENLIIVKNYDLFDCSV